MRTSTGDNNVEIVGESDISKLTDGITVPPVRADAGDQRLANRTKTELKRVPSTIEPIHRLKPLEFIKPPTTHDF